MLRIALGILLAVFGPLALEHYMSSLPEWMWRTIALICVASGLYVIADSRFIKPYWHVPHIHPVISTAIVATAAALIVAVAWCLFALDFSPSSEIAATKKSTSALTRGSSTRPTVHDLFLTDFPLLSRNGKAEAVSATSTNKAVPIEFRVWYDLEANAKFVSIYVPFSPATFEALKSVAEGHKDILNAKIQSITAPANPADATRMILKLRDSAFVGITFKNPHDSSVVNPLDFISTGKIYLYYEYELSISQLGSLENLFQSNGLSPQFRSWDYADLCWKQIEHEGKPAPKVEDVVARTAEFTDSKPSSQ